MSPAQQQSFGGLRVLELGGHVAGAYCAKLLAGFGAEVLRIPAPFDDPAFELDQDERAWFVGSREQRALDPRNDSAAFDALLADADLILDAWGVDALERYGYSAESIAAINPRAILCRITAFGQDGPRRGDRASDLTLYAASGLMHCTGDNAREPLNARPRVCEITAGMNAYAACLMALLRRQRDDRGELIDLAIFEAAMENCEVSLAEHLNGGKPARRSGDQPAIVPWRTYPCADGEATIMGGPVRNWLRGAKLFEAPELLQPPLATIAGRMQNRQQTIDLMRPWLLAHDKRDIFHAGQAQGLAWSYLASLQDALEEPQNIARGHFVSAGGSVRVPGAPFRLSAMDWSNAPAFPSPSGRRWSEGPDEGRRADSPHPNPHPEAEGNSLERAAPLAGLRILDFSHDWAGPHAGRLLADFGAEVIKIEYPKRLDSMRGGQKPLINGHARFWQLHRGKQSLTLDLTIPAHLKICEDLICDTDLILENSRPGVMQRKGLPWERLLELKPDIILLSMSAFGATGPYASYSGYGGTLEAVSGLQSLTGYSPEGAAHRIREMDVMNGIMGACAALTALWHRAVSGAGQRIDLSEYETTSWFIGEFFAACSRGADVSRIGNRHPRHAPQGCYAAAGEDRWLTLSARNDLEWSQLAQLIGGAALAADPRYASVAQRRAAHDEIDALITAWTRQGDPFELARQLQGVGVPAAAVANAADLAADPQLAARGWFLRLGEQRFPGRPFHFANEAAVLRHRGPDLGADNGRFFDRADVSQPELSAEFLGTAYDVVP